MRWTRGAPPGGRATTEARRAGGSTGDSGRARAGRARAAMEGGVSLGRKSSATIKFKTTQTSSGDICGEEAEETKTGSVVGLAGAGGAAGVAGTGELRTPKR